MKRLLSVICLAAGLSASLGFALSASAHAAMPTTYLLTVTNGSQMPLSPFAIYTENGQLPKAKIGSTATPAFIQLCQMGNAAARAQELGMDMDVTYKTYTTGLVMPGESRTIEVMVNDPLTQSIHFETMYGKTKDICGIAAISGHSLYALKQHVTSAVTGKDDVVLTGAFLDPALPMGQTYLDTNACAGAADATACIRSLAQPNRNGGKIRFFAGYLSSLSMFLETKYGAEDALSLAIPASGAIRYEVKLKH